MIFRTQSGARGMAWFSLAYLLCVAWLGGAADCQGEPYFRPRFSPGFKVPYLTEAPLAAGGALSIEETLFEGRRGYLIRTRRGGELLITPYHPRVVRVQWNWDRIVPKDDIAIRDCRLAAPAADETSSGDGGEYFFVRTAQTEVRIWRDDPLRVDFYDRRTGAPICLDYRVEYSPTYDPRQDDSYNEIKSRGAFPRAFRIKNTKLCEESSGFFGMGDWAGPTDRRGYRIQFWNEDTAGWKEFFSPKYTSFPLLYNVRQTGGGATEVYALFFNNSSRTMFDLGVGDPGKWSFEAGGGELDYFLLLGEGGGFRDILDNFTALTGRSALLPKWAYGYQMSRFTYSERDARAVVDSFREHNQPLSAMYIDLDYMDQSPSISDREWELHQLEWNPLWYPDPRGMTESLHSLGIGTVAMVEPFIDTRDPKFETAENGGFLVRDINGRTQLTDIWCTPSAGWIDFTNPKAEEWWRREVSEFVRFYGIRGIWNDLNETGDTGKIRLDGVYDCGGRFGGAEDPRRWHLNMKNTHCIYSTRCSYMALQEARPNERPFVLSRGGFPGIQRWAALWSGDNVSSEDHLRNNINASTGMALCGVSNYGHDIGGFTGAPDFELLQRWHEWSVFTPLMRNHSGKPNPPREPQLFPPEQRGMITATIRQRYYLLPHIYSLAKTCGQNGRPVISPPVAVFPGSDGIFRNNDSDFMFGDCGLVTPVVKLGADTRLVRFPKQSGRWHSFWDDSETHEGGDVAEVDAPLGRSPFYIRGGGIVAVNPDAPTVASPGSRDLDYPNVEFHVWGGGDGDFEFYDDNGTMPLDMADPERCSVKVNCNSFGANTVVRLRAGGNLWKRKFYVVFRGKEWLGRHFQSNGEDPETEERRGDGGFSWTGVKVPVVWRNGKAVVSSVP